MPDDLKTEVRPQPYSKSVRVVGYTDIDKRTGNLITAWADHCAYVAGDVQMTPGVPALGQLVGPTSGVAVIDVRNPAAPKVTRYLQVKGVPYLVGAGELGACPASWSRTSNIADEQHPRISTMSTAQQKRGLVCFHSCPAAFMSLSFRRLHGRIGVYPLRCLT
jgi:hypothetical protein